MATNLLPGMNVDPNLVMVAGHSNGSAMAMNLHIAFSETIKGAYLEDGGPRGRSKWNQFVLYNLGLETEEEAVNSEEKSADFKK